MKRYTLRRTALALAVAMLLGSLTANGAVKPETAAQEAPAQPAAPQKPVFTNRIAGNEDALDAALTAIAQENDVYGCSVAVFEREKILYTYRYGTASERGGVQAVTRATRFRTASIAKMVTTMLAMRLVDEGKLSLDGDISQLILPQLQNPYFPEEKATLQMLMTHTSGLTDSEAYQNAVNSRVFPTLTELLESGGVWNEEKPGTAYDYSNLGAGLVAAAVEKASGKKFVDYADATLFSPMGLSATYGLFTGRNRANVAQMRRYDPLTWDYDNVYGGIPLGQMYVLAHGDLYITAEDLARLCMVLAGDGTYAGRRYLSKEALARINRPYVYDEETNDTRGLTVQITDEIVDGVTLYGHQGNAYGAISCAFYDPLTQKGVVFLSNGADTERVESRVYRVNDSVVTAVWEYLG